MLSFVGGRVGLSVVLVFFLCFILVRIILRFLECSDMDTFCRLKNHHPLKLGKSRGTNRNVTYIFCRGGGGVNLL